jgi:hypothetical protein
MLGIQEQTNREITAAAYPQLNGSIGSTYYPNVGGAKFSQLHSTGYLWCIDAGRC